MGVKKAKPPKLPAGAPKELRDFLAGKRPEVAVDPAQLSWIPRPSGVSETFAASATVAPKSANVADVRIGWGFFSVSLPMSVVDGELRVDSSSIPETAGFNTQLDQFVAELNESLKANRKSFESLSVRDGKLCITTSDTPEQQEAVVPEPSPSTKPQRPRTVVVGVAAALAVALAIVAGVALFVATDESPGSEATPSAPNASTTVPVPPTTEAVDLRVVCADPGVLELTLAEFGGDNPCELPPPDFWAGCAEPFMPCFTGAPPLIVFGSNVGVIHESVVPDSTAEPTAQTRAEFVGRVVGPLTDSSASLIVQSQCGRDSFANEVALSVDGDTSITHPVLANGGCAATVLLRTAGYPPGYSLTSYLFDVTDATVPATEVDVTAWSVPKATSLEAAATTLGLLSGRAITAECTRFVAPPLDPVGVPACPINNWVFNSGNADARVVAHGGGFVNPLGGHAPTADQLAPYGPSRLFGPGTLFHCGPGYLGFTVCPPGETESQIHTSGFVAATVSFADSIDELAEGTFVEVALGDNAQARLDLSVVDGDFHAELSGEAESRAILRGNSVVFMFPLDDSPGGDLAYTISVGDSTGVIAQPTQPVLGIVTSTQGPESPADFIAALSASFADGGDLGFALDRLHPIVFEAFTSDECATEMQLRQSPDYTITFVSVGETAPWRWELPDGRAFDVAEATTVAIQLPGSPDPVDAHIVKIDRQYRWFTVCDGR